MSNRYPGWCVTCQAGVGSGHGTLRKATQKDGRPKDQYVVVCDGKPPLAGKREQTEIDAQWLQLQLDNVKAKLHAAGFESLDAALAAAAQRDAKKVSDFVCERVRAAVVAALGATPPLTKDQEEERIRRMNGSHANARRIEIEDEALAESKAMAIEAEQELADEAKNNADKSAFQTDSDAIGGFLASLKGE